MLSSAIILSLVLPLQISGSQPHFEPFVVQATIDAAVILGLPASKAARKYALGSQKTEFQSAQTFQASDAVDWRKLYFRKLFSS